MRKIEIAFLCLLLYPHPAPAKDKHKVPMAPLPAQIAKVQVAGTL
jgi:hypothetical protein